VKEWKAWLDGEQRPSIERLARMLGRQPQSRYQSSRRLLKPSFRSCHWQNANEFLVLTGIFVRVRIQIRPRWQALASRSPFGFLPVFLAAERRQIEEVVGATGRLATPTVGGIGVVNFVTLAKEETHSRQIERLLAL